MKQSLAELRSYFNLADSRIDLTTTVIDSLLLTLMVLIVSWLYVKTARTLSNRKRLAALLPILALTTMMIIGIIRTSLALSLGLVGALSIVRFRSAIKDPEELVYIFLAIGLGLGMGANQRATTILMFFVVTIFILVEAALRGRFKLFDPTNDQTLILSIKGKKKIELPQLNSILDKYTHFIDLKRIDDQPNQHEVLYSVKLTDHKRLPKLQAELAENYADSSVVIMNEEKLFG